jgi:hypothetical protein
MPDPSHPYADTGVIYAIDGIYLVYTVYLKVHILYVPTLRIWCACGYDSTVRHRARVLSWSRIHLFTGHELLLLTRLLRGAAHRAGFIH